MIWSMRETKKGEKGAEVDKKNRPLTKNLQIEIN